MESDGWTSPAESLLWKMVYVALLFPFWSSWLGKGRFLLLLSVTDATSVSHVINYRSEWTARGQLAQADGPPKLPWGRKLSALVAAYLQLGEGGVGCEVSKRRGWEEVAHQACWRDKKTLSPSQGLYFAHCEMIVPECRVNDGLLTVVAAINLVQRTAFQLLSSGTYCLSLMTLVMAPTCWWWMGLFPFYRNKARRLQCVSVTF